MTDTGQNRTGWDLAGWNLLMRIDCTSGRHWRGTCRDLVTVAFDALDALANAIGKPCDLWRLRRSPYGYIFQHRDRAHWSIDENGVAVVEPVAHQGSMADDCVKCIRVFVPAHRLAIHEVVRHWAETTLRKTLHTIEVDDVAPGPQDGVMTEVLHRMREGRARCQVAGDFVSAIQRDPELPSTIFVFDVESIGLFGRWFAVGYVVIHPIDWTELDSGYISFPAWAAAGVDPVPEFVTTHIIPALPHPTHPDGPSAVIAFREVWSRWKSQGALMAADITWPVEAGFLLTVLRGRPDLAPYPLLDIASVLYAAGMDPTATYERTEAEAPAHHPTADARQSARLLRTALEVIRSGKVAKRATRPELLGVGV